MGDIKDANPAQPADINADKKNEIDENKNVIEIWKKVIDVQQHFNDIGLRIRNYVLTLFTATIAGIGLLAREKIVITIYSISIPAPSLLAFAGIAVLFSFYYMDKYWYHRLLIGAVKQGSLIEELHKDKIKELGLTTAIGKSSPHKIAIFNKTFFEYVIVKEVHSNSKFRIFYVFLFLALLGIGIGFIRQDEQKYSNEVKTNHTVTKTVYLSIDSIKGKDTFSHPISIEEIITIQRDSSGHKSPR
jgi:hypothetical protein